MNEPETTSSKSWQVVLEAVYMDILGKRLMEVVPKGAFAPLFGLTPNQPKNDRLLTFTIEVSLTRGRRSDHEVGSARKLPFRRGIAQDQRGQD